jgi:survival-of-motor-neuron-related-splicing factor 30
MSESDLNTYKLQLQQVEAALTTDPDNEELTQLKTDLQQVITLTQDLINAQLGVGQGASQGEDDDDLESAFKGGSSGGGEKEKVKKSRWAEPDPIMPVKPWQVGENCQAIYSGDNMYHDAKIEEITADGEVSIKFKGYKGIYVTTLGLLRLPSKGTTTVHAAASTKNKKQIADAKREAQKEKKKKKMEKMKELEAEREKEKNKWTSFSSKAFGKKGFVKKSIFKTPETVEGKVGVGTCGISGQAMTEYSTAPKYMNGQARKYQ